MKNNENQLNALPLTSGFTQAGGYARRNICGNLEVYRPPEPLWNPRLREAATTLSASEREQVERELRKPRKLESESRKQKMKCR